MSEHWVVVEQTEGLMVDISGDDETVVFFVDYDECSDNRLYARSKRAELANSELPQEVKSRLEDDIGIYCG